MTIEIDFEVFKELTVRRTSEAVSYNDVVRSLLKLPDAQAPGSAAPRSGSPKPLVRKNVTFPSGTLLQAPYKGAVHKGKIEDGQIIVEGHETEPTVSFSRAARYITGNQVNGWTFWHCKRPQDSDWALVNSLRTDR